MIDKIRDYLRTQSKTGHVVTHETHISWVLLADDRALKIKKSIRNPFLDYRSLDQRLESCRGELRLNRRFTEGLYRGIVAIVSDADGVAVQTIATDPSEAIELPTGTVEVAVDMARFPDDALLVSQLQIGQAAVDDLDQFAENLATFHLHAEPCDADVGWGSAERVRHDQQDNLDYLREQASLDEEFRFKLGEVQEWVETSGQQLSDLFEQRRRDGMVRECHGDLHLENVVRWEDRFIPFDGIEFSEALRWIDVQSDAAFMSMDLIAHSHIECAHRFTDAYLSITGDYQGVAVLRWYQVYRALVRAKVAAIRLSQSSGRQRGGTYLPAENDVYAAIDVARTLAHNQNPRLWITHGLSGSGKTTGSQSWVDSEGMVRIRSDVERKRLAAQRPRDLATPRGDLSSSGEPAIQADSLYEDKANQLTYDRLAHAAEAVVRSGSTALIDAAFLCRSDRQRFRELAEGLGVPFGILAFDADPETLRQRLEQRQREGRDASDADVEVLQHQLQMMEPLADDERACVVS